jgi:ubiquinone/menaquinone biosynthesis C-methylase UbiE
MEDDEIIGGNRISEIIRGKKLDFELSDVQKVYEGPVGVLWEMLMGEQIHVGGARETDVLAGKIGINSDMHVLDVCSALGGPARYLAKNYGCRVTGIDATQKMFDEAVKRTEKEGLSNLISYELADSLNMPFDKESFDVVWGQDAWCYVTDKNALLSEARRVLIPKGTIAFTDWIQVGNLSEEEWRSLNEFMVFPYMETLEGYQKLLEETGFGVIEKEDLSSDFAKHCHIYQDMLRNELKDGIVENYGPKLFEAADSGLAKWVVAADEKKVGRGRWIAKKK